MFSVNRKSHEKITWSKKTGKAVTHGKPVSYSTHGCRCDQCWDAWYNSAGARREREIQALCVA